MANEPGPPRDAQVATNDAAPGDANSDGAAPDASTSNEKPPTPEIVSVMKMSGQLHVTWNPKANDLTKIELWRKKGTEDYKLAYTFAGAARDQHDAQAGEQTTYCYQVQTYRGSVASDRSGEKCGTP